MPLQQINRKKARTRGSTTLVEFAFVIPVLLAMMMGIADFGWLAKTNLQMNNAVREGARLVSIGKSTQSVQDLVKKRCSPLTVTITFDYSLDHGVTYQPVTTIDSVSPNKIPVTALCRVTVVNTYQPLTGIIPLMKGKPLVQRAEFGRE